jgi:hypothetical protein
MCIEKLYTGVKEIVRAIHARLLFNFEFVLSEWGVL